MDDSNFDYRRFFEEITRESFSDQCEEPALGSLGGYSLLEKIGEGGMGIVWLARESRTGRRVALKQLRFTDHSRTYPTESDATARFQREIALAIRLEHPGIARVYDSGYDEESGIPFFTMELIEGLPLGSSISPKEEESSILTLFVRVCEAVEYAHRNGVIHRDLKPANILVTEDGDPKVLDFGVARALEESEIRSDLFTGDPAMTLSREGEILGTPNHMAPEQARGETSRCDTRTDVYALGTILYQLLTGGYPHDPADKNTWELFRDIASEEPQRPAESAAANGRRRPSSDVEAILMKTLSHAPDDRYDSAGELGRDLKRFLEGIPVAAQPLTASYWLKKHVVRHRSRWLAGLTVTLSLLMISVTWIKERNEHFNEQVKLREEAEKQEFAARRTTVRSLIRLARQRTESGARGEGLAMLSRAVQLVQTDREARASLLIALKQYPTLPRVSKTFNFPGRPLLAAYSPDGSWLGFAIGSKESGLRIFDTGTLAQLSSIEGEFEPNALEVSPSGDYLAALLRYQNVTNEGKRSCLVLASPNGIIARQEFDVVAQNLSFSKDGQLLAIADHVYEGEEPHYGNATIWNIADPSSPEIAYPAREVSRPGFGSVFFSHTGNSLYFRKQEQDGRIHRWDLHSNEIVRTKIRASPDGWRPLHLESEALSNDGRIFVGGQGEFVSCWRDHGDRQERIWTSKVPGAIAITELALSEGDQYLAGTSTDSKAIVWESDSGRILAELPQTERLENVWFCPGKPEILATKSAARTVTLWNWKLQQPLAEPLEGGEQILSATFSPQGDRILVGRRDHARMWGITPRRWNPTKIDCGVPVDHVSFIGQNALLLATSFQGEAVFLCDAYSGQILRKWRHRSRYSHSRAENHFPAAFSRHKWRIATADSPKELVIRSFGPQLSAEAVKISLHTEATAIAFTRHGDHLAVGNRDHETLIFHLKSDPTENGNPQLLARLKGKGMESWELDTWKKRFPGSDQNLDNFVQGLAFSPNGHRLVMYEYPLSAITIWDWKNRRKIRENHVIAQDSILDLQISSNNDFLVFGGRASRMRTLRLSDGYELPPHRFHRKPMTRFRISEDGKQLMSAGLDGEVKFWDLSSSRPRPRASYQPSRSPIHAADLCPDNFLFATGDEAGVIRLWLASSAQPFADPLQAGSPVHSLDFHHGIPLLAAGCQDGVIRVWDIPTGRNGIPTSLPPLVDSITGVVYQNDGRFVMGGRHHYERSRQFFREAHSRILKLRQENPDHYPNEGHRIAFDILGFPPIPPPEWLDTPSGGQPKDSGPASGKPDKYNDLEETPSLTPPTREQ